MVVVVTDTLSGLKAWIEVGQQQLQEHMPRAEDSTRSSAALRVHATSRR